MATRATLIGLTAVLMWSFLSLLTVVSGEVPPFQLAAMAFAIGGALGALPLVRGNAKVLRQPVAVWTLGVVGLFGYHALYFLALRLAPPAEAQLVNYLWPLLIVLFAALLPGERLRPHHVAGALLGLAGTVLLFIDRGGTTLRSPICPASRQRSGPRSPGPPIRCCRDCLRRCRRLPWLASAWQRRRCRASVISFSRTPDGL
jgi:drug/metabolite transporter (DMT)-like permease